MKDELAHGYRMSDPFNEFEIKEHMHSYADDTNNMVSTNDNKTLTNELAKDLQQWNDLVEAAGGKLEPEKSVWFAYKWVEKDEKK